MTISIPPPYAWAKAVCWLAARTETELAALVAAVVLTGCTVGGKITVPGGTVIGTLVEPLTPPHRAWKYGITRCETRFGMRGPNMKLVSVVSRWAPPILPL